MKCGYSVSLVIVKVVLLKKKYCRKYKIPIVEKR